MKNSKSVNLSFLQTAAKIASRDSSRQPPPTHHLVYVQKCIFKLSQVLFSLAIESHTQARSMGKINIKSFHSLSAETIEVVRSAMRRWNTNPKPFVRKSFLQIVSVSLDSAQQMENGILINGKAGFSEWKSSSTSCDESTSNETFSVIVTGKAHNL